MRACVHNQVGGRAAAAANSSAADVALGGTLPS
jgi:hypothetical protein